MDEPDTKILFTYLAEIIIVLIVVSIPVSVATYYGYGDKVKMSNSAQDLAVMINVLVGMTGRAVIEYPNYNLASYDLGIDEEKQQVVITNEKKEEARSQFNLPTGYSVRGTFKVEKKVCLEKKEGKIILLRECRENEFRRV